MADPIQPTLKRYQFGFVILFFSFVAVGLIAPIASDTNMVNLADYINHVAMLIQAKMALIQGQFPLRTAPLEQSGWQYPYYQFYAPTVYTIAGSVYRWLTPSNPLMAMKITIWGSLLCAGVMMTRLCYWFTKSLPAAMLGGVAYLAAPYFIMIVDQLGSLAEIMALSVVPVAVYYTLQRYYYPNRNKTLVQMTFVWYLLITMHLPTCFYTGFFVGLLLLIATFQHPAHFSNLIRVGVTIALASMMAMWFLAPVALLNKFLMIINTANSADYFVQFKPLLSTLLFPSAIFTSGSNSALISFHPSIGWPILLAVAVCGYAYFTHQSMTTPRAQQWLLPLLLIFMVAFLLVWSPVNFWKVLPSVFMVGQRCWRVLAQVIWIGAILFSFATAYLFKEKLDLRHVMIGSLLIVMSAAAWFTEVKTVDPASLYKNPKLIYNENAYVLNFEKYPTLVDAIDNVLIDPSAKLKLNTPYPLAKSLLELAIAPSIIFQAHIPATIAHAHPELSLSLNNKVIGKKTLTAGEMTWQVPLPDVKTVINEKNTPALQFNLPAPNPKIKVDQILLTGFIHPAEKMDVDAIKKDCYTHHASIICKVNVPDTVKVLELPALYYPDLLKISINDKPVSYQSILYNGYLMTSVVPDAGKLNVIKINFTGLHWANWVSLVAWGGWVLLVITLLIKRQRKSSGT